MRIALFDSGIGGLSILKALHEAWPEAALDYLADSAHAPYGERSDAMIRARSMRLAAHLFDGGADALVVACNTATAVAIDALREAWPGRTIVGVEPGIKPAVALSKIGRIAVMATEATLRSPRLRRLLDAHASAVHVHLQPCAGLAAAIESGSLDDHELVVVVGRHCAAILAAQVDTVALGCTHYPLVQRHIAAALGPNMQIIDTSAAVARRVVDLCRADASAGEPETVRLRSTGDVEPLHRMAAHWLGFDVAIGPTPVGL